MMLVLLLAFTSFATDLELHFSKKDLRHFEQVKNFSLQKGYLEQEVNTPIRAQLKAGPNSLPVSVQLKGDLPRHWKDESKSLAIKIKAGHWNSLTKLEASIASDKYYFLPLWIYKTFHELGHNSPRVFLERIKFLPLGNQSYYLIEEALDEAFRERNRLPVGDFYRPNNQWVFSIKSPTHPYAIRFHNPRENHPFTKSCAFYKPTLNDHLSPGFCQALEELSTLDLERSKFNTDKMCTWLAISAFLGDTHSSIHDNHSWYVNFYTRELEVMPRDFIPLVPKVSNLLAFENYVKKTSPLLGRIFASKRLHRNYRSKLQGLVEAQQNHHRFFEHNLRQLELSDTEKKRMETVVRELKTWHDTLIVELKAQKL